LSHKVFAPTFSFVVEEDARTGMDFIGFAVETNCVVGGELGDGVGGVGQERGVLVLVWI
jgi:hypothetical protein